MDTVVGTAATEAAGTPPQPAAPGAPARPRPGAAWVATLAGMGFFALLAGAMWLLPAQFLIILHVALVTWGALILTFLGGVRWGIEVAAAARASAPPRWSVMAGAIAPSLLAWGATMAQTLQGWVAAPLALMVLVPAYLAMLVWDSGDRALPLWYRHLRWPATLAAAACLAAGAVAFEMRLGA